MQMAVWHCMTPWSTSRVRPELVRSHPRILSLSSILRWFFNIIVTLGAQKWRKPVVPCSPSGLPGSSLHLPTVFVGHLAAFSPRWQKSWTRTSRLECAQYGRISKPNLSLQDLTSCLHQHLRLESYPRILLRFKGTFFFFFFLAIWVTSSMIWGYDPVNSEASAGVENLSAASGKSWGSGQSMPVAPRIWIPICLEESLCLRVWLI